MSSNVCVVHNTKMPDCLQIPPAMGMPAAHQASGTALEILAETAGRICYDSYGQGRSSSDYHNHILEVRHLSVYEHCTFVVEFQEWSNKLSEVLLNRPGIFFRRSPTGLPRLTINARAVLEWSNYGEPSRAREVLRNELFAHAAKVMPQVFKSRSDSQISKIVQPSSTDEVWVSVWLNGSRGFSHEMVRHGDWTAISQRSTRYVDESQSPNFWHPDLVQTLSETFDDGESQQVMDMLDRLVAATSRSYEVIFEYLTKNGKDRKTARGAARGALLNALSTQLIFSASLSQWNHIFAMRCSPFADAEIRDIMMNSKRSIFGTEVQLESD